MGDDDFDELEESEDDEQQQPREGELLTPPTPLDIPAPVPHIPGSVPGVGPLPQQHPPNIQVRGTAVDASGQRVFSQRLADAELAAELDKAADSGRYMVVVYHLGPPDAQGKIPINMFRKLRDFPQGDFLEAARMLERNMQDALKEAEQEGHLA